MFVRTEEWSGYVLAVVTPQNIVAGCNMVNAGEVDGLRVTSIEGVEHVSDVIHACRTLKAAVFESTAADAEAFREPGTLEYYCALGADEVRDLRLLSGLKTLRVSAKKHLRWPSDVTSLTDLELHRWRPLSKNLDSIPKCQALQCLTLRGGACYSLSGVAKCDQLHSVAVSHNRVLTTVEALKDTRIVTMDLASVAACNNIAETAVKCRHLQNITLDRCQAFPNLEWIRKVPALRSFRFVNTDVIDGDLRPLLTLDDSGFYPDRRHYSHTSDELEAVIRARQEKSRIGK